jgi:hypothetical protein
LFLSFKVTQTWENERPKFQWFLLQQMHFRLWQVRKGQMLNRRGSYLTFVAAFFPNNPPQEQLLSNDEGGIPFRLLRSEGRKRAAVC